MYKFEFSAFEAIVYRDFSDLTQVIATIPFGNPKASIQSLFVHDDFLFDRFGEPLVPHSVFGEKFITNSKIMSHITPFTQNSFGDIASKTKIFLGTDMDSKLSVNVDMASYQSKSKKDVTASNGHMFIVGKSGSGKTYLAKSILFQKIVESNRKAFIFDIENEYEDIVNLINSALKNKAVNTNNVIKSDLLTKFNQEKNKFINFDVASSSEVIINPFHIYQGDLKNPSKTSRDSFIKHSDFVLTVIKDIFEIESNEFNLEIKDLISKTYAKKSTNLDHYIDSEISHKRSDEFPILEDFFEVVKEEFLLIHTLKTNAIKHDSNEVDFSQKEQYFVDIKSFLTYLYRNSEKLKKNKVFMQKFSVKSSFTMNDDNDVQIYKFNLFSLMNISGVIKDSKIALNLLLNFLYNQVFDKEIGSDNGIFVVVDETHRYLRKELIGMVDFLTQITKQGRKRSVELCIISQNISDFYRQSDSLDLVQKAQDVIKNVSYKFIMQLALEFDTALNFIESGYRISEKDRLFLKTLSRGQLYFVQGSLISTSIAVEQFYIYQNYLPLKNIMKSYENLLEITLDSENKSEDIDKLINDHKNFIDEFLFYLDKFSSVDKNLIEDINKFNELSQKVLNEDTILLLKSKTEIKTLIENLNTLVTPLIARILNSIRSRK